MMLRPDQALRVSLRWSEDAVLPVGRLAWRGRRAFFEFDEEMLARGLELSPWRLPLRAGVIEASMEPFGGLHGLFADSLPDGWGLLLQDRRARRLGLDPSRLSPLDRLAWVGDTGMGALVYEPELVESVEPGPLALDHLARESAELLAGQASEVLPTLLRLGGSPQGARPKVLAWLRSSDLLVVSGPAPGAGFLPVLIKFRAPTDPEDAGAIELAYGRMARRASIHVPESWRLPSQEGAGWFAVQRFDRPPGRRVHTATLCGLLHADHRLPSLDYVGALTAVLHLCRDHRALEAMYRRMVFNVLAHNRDDHSKQTSLCLGPEGEWTLSPAYDLTFSAGPGGEHSMAVAGSGEPGRADLLRVAAQVGLREAVASAIIEEVAEAVSCWGELAREAGVSQASVREIERQLLGAFWKRSG